VRVPLLVVSPWSSGGWVCSEMFDHTSLIRFIEARFGVGEPNITPWRRAVSGDLTSAFDFASATDSVPPLPSVAAYKPTGTTSPTYVPTPPASGSVPSQEPGIRPSRRLGYSFDVGIAPDPKTITLAIANGGQLGVGLQARSLTIPGAPYSYTVGAGDELTATLPNPGAYDLSVHGPNGFFRHAAGSPATVVQVEVRAEPATGGLTVALVDGRGRTGAGGDHGPLRVDVADAYGSDRQIALNGAETFAVQTSHSGGWYDIALSTPSDAGFSYVLAGRLESSAELTSDPQLGGAPYAQA
jgi:phospholipase C